MTVGLILTILLVLLLVAAIPTWPYSRNWGYGPGGLATALLVVLLILVLVGTVPWGFGPPAGPPVGPTGL